MRHVDEESFHALKHRARALGLYIGEHREFDPGRGNGPLFVMPRRKSPDERVKSLLRYATVEQARHFLEAYEEIQNENEQREREHAHG